MEQLLSEAIKNGEGSTFVWVLIIWVLIREFAPLAFKKLRNGKTPYLEIIKEKVDFLYLREKKRETIEEYKTSQGLRRSTDRKEN